MSTEAMIALVGLALTILIAWGKVSQRFSKLETVVDLISQRLEKLENRNSEHFKLLHVEVGAMTADVAFIKGNSERFQILQAEVGAMTADVAFIKGKMDDG